MRAPHDYTAGTGPKLSDMGTIAQKEPERAQIYPFSPANDWYDATGRGGVAARPLNTQIEAERYETLDVAFDPAQHAYWCFLKRGCAPSFTPGLLRDLGDMQRSIKRLFAQPVPGSRPTLRFFVGASHIPGVFNLGGDLPSFIEWIRAGDRATLTRYAHACIDIIYANTKNLDLPIVTIALVQGDALGGGFETALSFNVIVAEKSAKFGLPEILFNLFPGMGAYSILSRRLDAARAERIITSGRLYTAAELHDMGLVDVLAEDGEGEQAVRDFIDRTAKRHNAFDALNRVRRQVNPLPYEELQTVTDIWVDTALNLGEADLRKMQRIATAQERRQPKLRPVAAS